MALKDIFKMTKANRYTADGREELIKAQEAETEDRRYNIGEISEKTGLQKTANGWVKPKGGAERNHGTVQKKRGPGAIHTPGKGNVGMDKMKEAAEKGLKGQELKEFMIGSKSESKPAPKSLAGTPMKKADLNSKDPYEITHSMKPDTASEAKEMDKISAFMQEETGATLRNAITARESFYKNTKNPTPEQQKGLAALMKIQQKLGYGKPAEGPALNGQKKTVSHQEYRDGPMYGPAESKPTAEKQKTEKGPSIPKPSVQEYMKAKQRVKAYEEKYKKDMDDYEYMERIKANGVDTSIFNPMYGGKPKPLEENKSYMEELNKIKAYEAKDSAPRVLTGDTRIRVRK